MPPRAFFSKDPSRRMTHQEKSTSAATLYARATLYDPKSIRTASSPLTRLLPAARPRSVRRPGMRGRPMADPQKWVNRPLSPGTVYGRVIAGRGRDGDRGGNGRLWRAGRVVGVLGSSYSAQLHARRPLVRFYGPCGYTASRRRVNPVSYTHLTLPTILLV